MNPPTRVIRGSLSRCSQPGSLDCASSSRAARLGVHDHRAELEQPELLAAASDALLVEQDRAAAVEPDDQCQEQEERRAQDQQRRRADDVHAALRQASGAREHGRVDPEHGDAPDVIHLCTRPDGVEG